MTGVTTAIGVRSTDGIADIDIAVDTLDAEVVMDEDFPFDFPFVG